MRLFTLVLAASVVGLSLILIPARGAGQQGGLTGDIPTQGGVALAVWSGGAVDDLIVEAESGGCSVVSVWTTPQGGGLVGYIPTPIAVVNAAFFAAYADGVMPDGAVLIVCRPGIAGPPPAATPSPTATPTPEPTPFLFPTPTPDSDPASRGTFTILSAEIVHDDAGTPGVFVTIENTGSVELLSWSVVICVFDDSGEPIYITDRFIYRSCVAAESDESVAVGATATAGWVFSEAPELACVTTYYFGATYPGGAREAPSDLPRPEDLECSP